MLKEFKEFLNRGNVVYIAVGLVLALYFQKIVDAIVVAIINPLISLVFGSADIAGYVADVNGTKFPLGLIFSAAITFVFVAFVLFMIVKAYDKANRASEEDAGPTEIDLLTEIRDNLKR